MLVVQNFSAEQRIFHYDMRDKMLILIQPALTRAIVWRHKNRKAKSGWEEKHSSLYYSFTVFRFLFFFIMPLCRYSILSPTIELELLDIWHALANEAWKDVTLAISEQLASMCVCTLFIFSLLPFSIKQNNTDSQYAFKLSSRMARQVEISAKIQERPEEL